MLWIELTIVSTGDKAAFNVNEISAMCPHDVDDGTMIYRTGVTSFDHVVEDYDDIKRALHNQVAFYTVPIPKRKP